MSAGTDPTRRLFHDVSEMYQSAAFHRVPWRCARSSEPKARRICRHSTTFASTVRTPVRGPTDQKVGGSSPSKRAAQICCNEAVSGIGSRLRRVQDGPASNGSPATTIHTRSWPMTAVEGSAPETVTPSTRLLNRWRLGKRWRRTLRTRPSTNRSPEAWFDGRVRSPWAQLRVLGRSQRRRDQVDNPTTRIGPLAFTFCAPLSGLSNWRRSGS